MFTSNAFVIYFAIGVPFGVLSLYFTNGRIFAEKVLSLSVNLILWPVVATKAFAASYSGVRVAPVSDLRYRRHARLDALRERYLELLSPHAEPVARRKLSFDVERSFSLINALMELCEDESQTHIPILALVKPPFPDVAEKCRGRRLRRQLSDHLRDSIDTLNRSAQSYGVELPIDFFNELLGPLGAEFTNQTDIDAVNRKAA